MRREERLGRDANVVKGGYQERTGTEYGELCFVFVKNVEARGVYCERRRGVVSDNPCIRRNRGSSSLCVYKDVRGHTA
jgi:hypothetical protein